MRPVTERGRELLPEFSGLKRIANAVILDAKDAAYGNCRNILDLDMEQDEIDILPAIVKADLREHQLKPKDKGRKSRARKRIRN